MRRLVAADGCLFFHKHGLFKKRYSEHFAYLCHCDILTILLMISRHQQRRALLWELQQRRPMGTFAS